MTRPRDPLIYATELAALLRASGDVRLLDVRAGAAGRAAFEAGHLPGAVYVDLDRDLAAPAATPERGGRHPLPPIEVWAARLGAWGIRPETDVVVYDARDGAMAASRCWWMLRAAGHERARLLDGGFAAAQESGAPELSAVAETISPPPAPEYPVRGWLWPTASADEVEERRRDPAWRVVDVRDEVRFRGESETFDPVAGHIPGAVNLPYRRNLADGRFLAGAELASLYEETLAGTPPERVIVHCGSGVTACHTLLGMERAGLRGAKLYVGSWSEWCRSGREQETG